MDKKELRDFWINYDGPAIVAQMKDGAMAMLIIGPRDADVEAGRWRFGFQVHGEEEIRWREAEAFARRGNGLIETS